VTPEPLETLTPWRCRAAILLAVLAAYLIPLWNAGFNEIDDSRFTYENEHIKQLDLGRAVRIFTDKTTLDGIGLWQGTYRPLRTLDFAIDWAISGKDPRTFHLHNLLYHLVASLLLFGLFKRLSPDRSGGPLLGTLLFALHPAHTECVAWITSRGDLLVLLWFVGAIRLHLSRRYVLSTSAFVLALFSKESAVVFPAAALLLDLFARGRGSGVRLLAALFRLVPAAFTRIRRAGARRRLAEVWREAALPWRPYLAYGALAAGYYLLWRGMMEHPGHLQEWWGGSYGANLQAMARGFAYYLKNLALPVLLIFDYYVPATPAFDLGTLAGLVLLAGVLLGCVRGSARFRFAAAWFFITMLPTSNLIQTVGIPTAERFLYVPSVGFAFWAGGLPARVKPRWIAVAGSVAVVLCFGSLTFVRAGVWKSGDHLQADSASKARTPRIRIYLAAKALIDAHAAHAEIESGNRDPALAARLRNRTDRVFALADEQMDELERKLRISPGVHAGHILSKVANALLLLERDEEAYDMARRALGYLRDVGAAEPHPHYNMACAARRLGLGLLARVDLDAPRPKDRKVILRAADYIAEAAEELALAWEAGYPDSDLRGPISGNFATAAQLRIRVLRLGGSGAEKRDLAARAGRETLRAGAALVRLRQVAGMLMLVSTNELPAAGEAVVHFTNGGLYLEDAARHSLACGDRATAGDLRRRASDAFLRAAILAEALEDPRKAAALYQRCIENAPAAQAREALGRLGR
jgi:hypothetical protein